jgi:ankyrin repeat protein
VRGQEPDSIETARVLLKHGFDMNEHAFTEGTWRATPVWHAIGRGANLALAEFLLKRGADPNHSLWAASFRRDRAAIRLLVRHGAEVDEQLRGSTPFLGAIEWSLFDPAEELLELGADPNFRDAKGMTALHYMLKKGSDKKHFSMLLRHGARGDIPSKNGQTAADIMARKRDPAFREMAEQLRDAARGKVGSSHGVLGAGHHVRRPGRARQPGVLSGRARVRRVIHGGRSADVRRSAAGPSRSLPPA